MKRVLNFHQSLILYLTWLPELQILVTKYLPDTSTWMSNQIPNVPCPKSDLRCTCPKPDLISLQNLLLFISTNGNSIFLVAQKASKPSSQTKAWSPS